MVQDRPQQPSLHLNSAFLALSYVGVIHNLEALMSKRVDLRRIYELRKREGLNQNRFWSRFGVTQSGGSRYESGRQIPLPTSMLLWLRETGAVDDALLEAAKKAVAKH